MKSLMMIGGGAQQMRAIEIAHVFGFSVVVTDRHRSCPCSHIADDIYEIDGRDVESLVALGLHLKSQGRLDGVFTFTELVTSVAAVAEACEFVGSGISASVKCQDKGLTKQIWLAAGLATPFGVVYYGQSGMEKVIANLDLPLIIKPVIGSGGSGMTIVTSVHELHDWLNNVQSNISYSSRVVVEELISGTCHDVNGLFDHFGAFHPYGIVDRDFLPGSFVENSITAPSALSLPEQNSLYELLEQSARALGINSGPVKGDAIFSNQKFNMLEIAPRLHGPKFSLYAMPAVIDDYLRTFFEFVAGEDNLDCRIKPNGNFFKSSVIPSKPGTIERIEYKGAPLMRHHLSSEIMIFKGAGETVPIGKSSHDAVGYVMSVGDSCDEVQNAVLESLASVKVIMST